MKHCIHPQYSRLFEQHYRYMNSAEVWDIFRLTGCKKPCRYKKYSLIGNKQFTILDHEDFTFSLLPVSMTTRVESEVLVYPLASLVAEFGGTLGTGLETRHGSPVYLFL